MPPTSPEPSHVTDLQFEVHLAATPETVFKALSTEIAQWWPAPFYCGGGRSKPVMRMEARPGGRMYEDWGGSDGLLWGTVTNVVRPNRLELSGTTGLGWGGPSTWYGSFEFVADAGGTTLRFSESTFGRTGELAARDKEKGWRFLLDGALRAFVEGKTPPAWQD